MRHAVMTRSTSKLLVLLGPIILYWSDKSVKAEFGPFGRSSDKRCALNFYEVISIISRTGVAIWSKTARMCFTTFAISTYYVFGRYQCALQHLTIRLCVWEITVCFATLNRACLICSVFFRLWICQFRGEITCVDIGHYFGLRLQAKRYEFQDLWYPNYPQVYQGMYSPSFVFVLKSSYSLYL